MTVFPQEHRGVAQLFIVKHIALTQGGIELGLGGEPAEIDLQPVDEGRPKSCSVGRCLGDLRLRFKDALAQSVVQVADLGGFWGLRELDFTQAVLRVVFEDSQTIAGQVACGIQAVVNRAGGGSDRVADGVDALGSNSQSTCVRASTAGTDRRHGFRGHLAERLLLCDVRRPDP